MADTLQNIVCPECGGNLTARANTSKPVRFAVHPTSIAFVEAGSAVEVRPFGRLECQKCRFYLESNIDGKESWLVHSNDGTTKQPIAESVIASMLLTARMSGKDMPGYVSKN